MIKWVERSSKVPSSAQSYKKKYEKFDRYQDIVYVLEMRRPETDKMSSHVVSSTIVAYGGYSDRIPPNLKTELQ